MKLSPSVALQLITIFQALFFAGFLVLRRLRSRPANSILAALLAVLAAQLGANLVVDGVFGSLAPPDRALGLSLLVDGTCGFLYGPLLLGFVRALIFGRPGRVVPHLLPFFLALPLFVWHIVVPDALTLAVFVSLGIYLFFSYRAIEAYRRGLAVTRSDAEPVRLACLSFAVLGLGGALCLDVASYLAGMAGFQSRPILATCLFAVLLVWVSSFVLAALWEPQLFAQIPEPERAVASSPTPALTQGEEEDLHHLESLMKERRHYLQPQLTLAELSEESGLPLRRLSNLVNRGRSQTFSDWVNGYRVEEAKRLLRSDDGRSLTILTILAESGFNSKSTFNTVFKQKTGLSPSDWKRQTAGRERESATEQASTPR